MAGLQEKKQAPILGKNQIRMAEMALNDLAAGARAGIVGDEIAPLVGKIVLHGQGGKAFLLDVDEPPPGTLPREQQEGLRLLKAKGGAEALKKKLEWASEHSSVPDRIHEIFDGLGQARAEMRQKMQERPELEKTFKEKRAEIKDEQTSSAKPDRPR